MSADVPARGGMGTLAVGGELATQLDALAAHVRDPDNAPAPAGVEERRLRVYRELFLGNIEGLLTGNFPVLAQLLGEEAWRQLVRGFYRDHGSRTPLFHAIGGEFLDYLGERAATAPGDPPWLRELAHYEWAELALQVSEATLDATAHAPDGDLLEGAPLVSPLAWPLAYAWPVHRLAPGFVPTQPPDAPALLLLRREASGEVSFHELGALTVRLLQRLEASPACSGREHLQALAAEAGSPDVAAFVADGTTMLAQLRAEGTVIGTRVPGPRGGVAATVC